MSPIRTIARPLLSAPFVADAVTRLRTPGPTAAALRPHVKRLAHRFPVLRQLADRPELVTRAVGGVEAAAALLLALGKAPRLSASLIVATQATTLPSDLRAAKADGKLVPVAVSRAGMVGGALVASVDSATRHRVKAAKAKAAKATKRAEARATHAESRAAKALAHSAARQA